MRRPRASWAHCWWLALIPVAKLGVDTTALKNTFVIVAGYLSHRDGGAGRCGVSRRESL